MKVTPAYTQETHYMSMLYVLKEHLSISKEMLLEIYGLKLKTSTFTSKKSTLCMKGTTHGHMTQYKLHTSK